MKKKKQIILALVAVIIVLTIVITVIAFIPRREKNVENAESTKTQAESIKIHTSPIIREEKVEPEEEKADIELDIGSVSIGRNPEVIKSEIEYGTKEIDTNEESYEKTYNNRSQRPASAGNSSRCGRCFCFLQNRAIQ